MKTFQNMHNIVSIKTYLTYGERATCAYMQDSNNEKGTKKSLVLNLSKNKSKR